ncbi:hypothetical protein PZA11_004465 [Diplocarpon coronariae]
MQSAKEELARLFSKIESVRTRAIETEQTITSMTADIKRLDGTKRNLTLSMTALKRLQMLTTAYEQLRGLAKTRQYKECASLLQAVLQLMRHFNSYRSIDQIATLSRNVAELQRELLEQVCEDFEMTFAKGEVAAKKGVLGEACLVTDALGENARARLVTWYINTHLREYRQVFRGNDEAGSLDNIGRRYSWFKRMLKTYEEEHAGIFPLQWRVNEVLANAFCEGTRDDFKGILERSIRRPDAGKIDVNLLLSCLQETMDFEQGLEKRFASEPRESIDTLSSVEEKPHTFDRSISEAFEPYLSLWVESQDKQLAAMILKYRSQPLLPHDEEFSPQAVIQSSIELFHFYKLTLAQCAKLSTGERLLDLSKTLAKYLDEYAQQVLLYFLQTPGGASLENTILVLNTADYWHANTQQLEDNLKKRIDSELAPRVDLSSQCDTFMGVASAAVLALVHRPRRRDFANTGQSTAYLIHVGDRSDTNFRKILELKGIRKQDQPSLVEMYGMHRDSKSNDQLVAMSPLLTPLMNAGGIGSGGLGLGGTSALGAAAGISSQTRFDPAGFGEKLFSAARDGVERMGTPSSGLAAADRIGGPLSEDAKAAVEGNLKSIGKFFRRDMSGFGSISGRFGGSSNG